MWMGDWKRIKETLTQIKRFFKAGTSVKAGFFLVEDECTTCGRLERDFSVQRVTVSGSASLNVIRVSEGYCNCLPFVAKT